MVVVFLVRIGFQLRNLDT